jgi:uncharacterized protein YjbI with pentapeptide repeats
MCLIEWQVTGTASPCPLPHRSRHLTLRETTRVCSYSRLKQSTHAGKDLRKLSFVKASLRRVNFDNANLAGTSMFGATCTDCSFNNANLRCVACQLRPVMPAVHTACDGV